MRNNSIIFSTSVFIVLLNACDTRKSDTKEKKTLLKENLFFGQKPPGLMPKPFAPGLVTSDGWECCGSITPDLNEFYFLREVAGKDGNSKMELAVLQNINDDWKTSVVSSRQGTPFISPDGKKMYLSRKYRERTNTGDWSEIKELNAPFDSLPTMRLTVSSKGTYYFDEFKRDLTGDIRYARIIDGTYEEPKLVSKEINSGRSFHPFIASDESYLIFDSKREEGHGDSDIYVSFRKQDGSWGYPINLGDKINTQAWEACASVSPDGKYLFFSRNMGSDNYENVDIFWVSMQVIEKIRPK